MKSKEILWKGDRNEPQAKEKECVLTRSGRIAVALKNIVLWGIAGRSNQRSRSGKVAEACFQRGGPAECTGRDLHVDLGIARLWLYAGAEG